MQKVFLYNSLSKRTEEFLPRDEGEVKLYTCGPTVYHFAHIGNLRSYIVEDVLEKFLRYIGYVVTRVMNVTDVGHLASDADTGEDKMITGARREGKTVMEIAGFYADAFFSDCVKLNIRRPDIVERATDCIGDCIRLIGRLFNAGYAYEAGGNVYFDTAKLERYYVFAGHRTGDLAVGVREGVTEDSYKRNPCDFALWFTKAKFGEQELRWASPWGTGYPGWHIECSAIAMKHLGEYVDIHCGGIDNMFPHHNNEIAQSEAALGHAWCRHWFHVQHLVDQSGKMSKSKGDFLTLSRLEEMGFSPMTYRLFCLQSQYRKPLEYSRESMEAAENTYRKLSSRISDINGDGDMDDESIDCFRGRFISALGNDLNTSTALTVLYDVLKSDTGNATKRLLIEEFDTVLSLGLTGRKSGGEHTVDSGLADYVSLKMKERNAARANKDYALADAIRDELLGKGILLSDTREGTAWTMDARKQ